MSLTEVLLFIILLLILETLKLYDVFIAFVKYILLIRNNSINKQLIVDFQDNIFNGFKLEVINKIWNF